MGRCAKQPLIVRAFNLDNPLESLEGIPLSFEITQGSGIFTEEIGYSTVSNAHGQAALHYHYADRPGLNKVQVSVLGYPEAAPVEFILEGYLPQMNLIRQPELVVHCPFDSLGDVFQIKLSDPRKNGIGIQSIEVKTKILRQVNGTIEEWKGAMLPRRQVTDVNGETVFSFATLDLTNEVYFRFYLPDFIDPQTNEFLKIETANIQWIGTDYLKISSGYAQVETANHKLKSPLGVYVGKYDTSGNPIPVTVVFSVKSGGGTITGANPQLTANGYASVEYTCGPKSEPQIIEAYYKDIQTGKEEKVYFTTGIPEVKLVREFLPGSNLFVYPGYVIPANLDDVRLETKYIIEAQLPHGISQPVTAKLISINLRGEQVAGIEGAIAPLLIENIPLTKVPASNNPDENRFALYRSDINNPLIVITKTILPPEEIPSIPVNLRPIQILKGGRGTVQPIVTFEHSPADDTKTPPENVADWEIIPTATTSIKISVPKEPRKFKGLQFDDEVAANKIFPVYDYGTEITFTAKYIKEKKLQEPIYYKWDFGDDSPVVEGETVKHKFEPPLNANGRRKDYMVTLTITIGKGHGAEIKKITYEISVAQKLIDEKGNFVFYGGTHLPKPPQEFLDDQYQKFKQEGKMPPEASAEEIKLVPAEYLQALINSYIAHRMFFISNSKEMSGHTDIVKIRGEVKLGGILIVAPDYIPSEELNATIDHEMVHIARYQNPLSADFLYTDPDILGISESAKLRLIELEGYGKSIGIKNVSYAFFLSDLTMLQAVFNKSFVTVRLLSEINQKDLAKEFKQKMIDIYNILPNECKGQEMKEKGTGLFFDDPNTIIIIK